ncbi:MAG: hypothetical protein ACC662_12280, partial [Planctomycetota bacterium]
QFGSHDGADFIGTRDRVTYVAGPTTGRDTLECEVFIAVNGVMESLGKAAAEIRVEDEPTIIFGSYAIHVFDGANNVRGMYADVVWGTVAGAKSYQLRGYGGNDPYYYLEGPITKSVYPNSSTRYHDHQDEIPSGEIWITLSALWSSVDRDGWSDTRAYFDGRFADGWIWEVEILR